MSKPQSALLASPKLNQTDAAKALGVSVSHFKRMVASNDCPQPIYIGTAKRWLESELEDWIVRQNPQLQDALELRKQAEAVLAKSKFKKRQKAELKVVGGQ